MSWRDLSEQVQEDLVAWFNVVDPDDEDKERLAELFEANRFWAWDCPECRERVYWAEPDSWDKFQGVLQADYTSYPGRGSQVRQISQMCDDCRMKVVLNCKLNAGDLNLVSAGEPPCWI